MSFIILRAPSPYRGLLDLVSDMGYTPSAAFSVRRLWKRYTGPLLRVLRASDSTEQDIRFDDTGWLDRGAISDFCQGTTGTVSTWYDQSGYGTNATQGAAASQFTVFTGNAVPQWSNRSRSPAYRFNIASGNFMSFSDANLASGANPSTTIAVDRQSIVSGVRNVWGYGTIAASASRQRAVTNATIPRATNGTTAINTITTVSNLKVISILRWLNAGTFDGRETFAYNTTETMTTGGTAASNTVLAGASGGLVWRAPAGGSSSSAAGFISELIHITGYMADAQCTLLEDELEYIWNFNA